MEALSARAGRTWDRSVLSNFKRGAFLPGPKLAIAISDHFQIERPFFVARTESEAATIRMLQQIAAPSDHEAPPPVRSGAEPQRLQHLDEDLHQLESEARQITSVPSKDESRAKSRKRT